MDLETSVLAENQMQEIPEAEVMPEEVMPEMIPQGPPPLQREEVEKAFETLLRNAKDEDQFLRFRQINEARRLDYYWNNILTIFRDPYGNWQIPNWDDLDDEIDPRLINIYRPHGEAIVAALSVAVPAVYFHPDDADNPDDVEAARGYRNIVELLQLHNDAPMQVIKMIVTLFNYGTIFGYNYYQSDPNKFGTFKSPQIALTDIATFESTCPQCGEMLDAGQEQPQMAYQCQTCGYQGPAEVRQSFEKIPQIVGWDETPKGTVCQELYSLLNVKISAYVKKQEDLPYLNLEFLQSTSLLRSIFAEQAKNIEQGTPTDWEGYAKIPIQYLGQMPNNSANVSCFWVRPWYFYQLGMESELVGRLVEEFPKGAYAIFINDKFITAAPENMDEHWTISANPMGDNLYARPLGENLATIQDIRANLVEIEVQTAEYGIPEMFVEPGVIEFDKYKQGRNKVGMLTQAKAKSGKSLQDSFFNNKPAILSPEINPLKQQMDQDAQFVSGSFASVYGGQMIGGSKTASEYAQSKASALQRLGTIWKIACEFWSNFQSRSAVEYAEILKTYGQDEKFTKRDGNNFVNNWIRVASLEGKIGRVEAESSEQLPVSWAAKKDQIQQLLTLNNPEILAYLGHPRNVGLVKDVIGLKDLYIPGEESRLRQLSEFQLLSQGIYVPIQPEIDNSQIHIETLQTLLEGPARDGLSEQGFQMSMMHLQEHIQLEQMRMQQQQEQQMALEEAGKQGTAPEKESQGEKDVD